MPEFDKIIEVISLAEQTAIALNAAARLQPPVRTVVVDTAYVGVSSPWQFGTVADALAYVRAQEGVWRVIIGFGLELPSNEDIYDLVDVGLFVEFSFDPWGQYIKYGGTLSESELLYTVDESRLTFNITG
jgi:hypothetical protein